MTSDAIAETPGRRWAGRRVLLVALWLTLLLLAIKLWISWATRSLSLAVDALHTLMTSFSLLLSLFAVSPSPQLQREWGHRRLESTLLLSLVGFVGFTAALLLGLAAHRLGLLPIAAFMLEPIAPINVPLLQLLSVVAAIHLGLGSLGRYIFRPDQPRSLTVSPEFGFSQSLLDAGLMILVVAGLHGTTLGMGWLDGVLAIGLLVVTIVSLGRIANRQLPSLMQPVAIAPEAIAKTTRRVEGILHCYKIQSRGLVGRSIYVEMHLILHPECVSVAPAIRQRVERLISQHYGPARVVVHIDNSKSL